MSTTNKEEQKQYNIKEYAVGNVNKRNMFTTDIPSIVEQNLTSQIYQSYFDHSDKIIQWWETHQNDNGENTVAGYKKSVSIKDIIIDIDDNDDLNNAKKSASIILNRLKNKYGINLIYTYPNFSGSKGFHIRIPSELFGGFESCPELPEIIKSICKKIAEDIKIDETIYHTTAIIRVPNTINTKKNLYAIPLTDIDVTNLGIEKILEMAERPQNAISRSRYFKSYPKLVELKNNVIKELSSKSKISTKAERVNAEQEGSTKSFNLSDEIKLDNNTTKLVKEIDDKTPIFCPFCDHTKRSHPNSANAFIDKNNEGFYYIYCSSESKTYWQKSFRVSGIFTKEKNEYYKIKLMGKEFVETKLSSFIIEPKELLVLEDSDTLRCDIKTSLGKTYENILIENKDWLSKSKLLTAIGHQDCVFLGSDNDVQLLCDMINQKVPIRKTGTKVIGLHDDTWVIDKINITAKGITTTPTIIPSEKGGEAFNKKITYPVISNEDTVKLIQKFYDNILNINRVETILPFVSWSFISPLKPAILKVLDGFPHLFVHGGQGSGKTSTALMMMKLFGYNTSGTFSCTLNPFPMLKLMSSTNAIPLIFDEFKKQDLSQYQMDNIHRLMRKSYSAEVETKGKPDQTTIDYRLTAPMIVMGEWNTTQPAIRERIIISSYNNVVKENLDMQKAFDEVKQIPLESFMNSYIPFILAQDVAKLLTESKTKISDKFNGMSIAPRVLNNLSIMYGGYLLFMRFAEANNISINKIDIDKVLDFQLQEITGSGTGQVESAIDQLIEGISTMAAGGNDIAKEYDYRITIDEGRKCLALPLKIIIPKFKEWARRTSYDIEMLDDKSYGKLFDDTSYVIQKDKVVKLNNKPIRCLYLDIEKAANSGVDLEGFVNPILSSEDELQLEDKKQI